MATHHLELDFWEKIWKLAYLFKKWKNGKSVFVIGLIYKSPSKVYKII
jgi:macrodomain Ter protein organizer (MatP/YcbG family)